MVSSNINCKKVFQDAYEKRYTWPKAFNGYQGKCIFIAEGKSYEGEFILDKTFKPEIKNIGKQNIEKNISAQLFEVSIHRVKREFKDVHQGNQFKFLGNTDKGIEMKVCGKNDGDRYRVENNRINMVFRKIHGVVVEIFVEEFLDTGFGLLSKKYTSQQLNITDLSPKSQKLKYFDQFIELKESNLWVLGSRNIEFLDQNNQKKSYEYLFKDICLIK